ncbi:HD domain-containing protein [Dongia sp.]|uniref:HD domain-containing protein n=1 Tax=Dongia sp. TaxID=1977262 RepID=UPI003753DA02
MDQLAWNLINTPEFQRLRRIKQLGVSEFVFPGATHTRFSHSIGVFHTARTLVDIIRREIGSTGKRFKDRRGEVAVIAALLHDLGHGPFSHTFEGVQKAAFGGVSKRHEKWTAEIIRNPTGRIKPLLDARYPDGKFTEEVALLLEAEDPIDIYHAVVSSSFDADRLDYLRRDRLMTGTGAGAIDFDWLMEHVRVGEINIDAPEPGGDEGDQLKVLTFCLDDKALPAAEQFLLARYTLHEQVYFHKTTRCVEQMISKLLSLVAVKAKKAKAPQQTGLDKRHPLLSFFGKDGYTLESYLALDDVVVLGGIELMSRAGDPAISELARRICERRLFKTLDLRTFGLDSGSQQRAARRINADFKDKLGTAVLKDEGAAISIYTQIGGDDDKAHKKLHILDERKGPVEIATVSDIVKALEQKEQFTRYYFESESDREKARNRRKGVG